jgi:putative transposase
VTQQARNLLMDLGDAADRLRFLVRDRDTNLTGAFDAVFTAAGVKILRTPPRSPRANAYSERWVRTARTECLDWILVCNDRHLHRVLTEYVTHYNTARPHRGRSLSLPVPAPPADVRSERIERSDVVDGLIHEYRHAA